MSYKFNPLTGRLDLVSSPGGSDTNIQYNDGGAFGGDSELAFNDTTKQVTAGRIVKTTPVKASGLGPELLTDGGFETWTSPTQLTHWTTQVAAGSPVLTRVTSPVQAGTYAAEIQGNGSNPDLLALESNLMSGTPGDTIVFTGHQTENSMAVASFGTAYFLNGAFSSATEIYNFDTNLWETLSGGGVWATIFGAVDPGVYFPQIAPSATYTQVTDTLPVPASGSFVCMALGVPYGGGGAFTQFIDSFSVKIQVASTPVTIYDFRNDTVFANLDASDTFVKFSIGVVDGLKINGVGAWTTNFPSFNLTSKEVGVATATQSSSAVTLAQLQAGYQPLDADLTAIAAITANGLIKRTGAGTWAGAQTVGLTTEVTGVLPPANGGSGTAVQFTTGALVYAGASGVYTQDPTNLFFNDGSKRLGLRTNSPQSAFHMKVTNPDYLYIEQTATSTPYGFRLFSPDSDWFFFANPSGNPQTFSIYDGIAFQSRFYIDATGNIGFGTTTPTARLHLPAGSATANTAPLKFTSGTSLTTAEAGAMEFTTDDFFLTITTGAARKGVVLDDGTRLTSGKIPIATTNGRLIDGETPLSGTKVYYVSDTNGGPVDRKLTFINGILTAET